MMMLPRFLLISLLVLFTFSVEAAEGKQRLDRFLHELTTLQGDFIQSVVDPEGRLVEESEGVLSLMRPGRFRIEYSSPYPQLYVADGEKVWHYDHDLEQVTVRPQQDALGDTPALLLSSTEPLENDFLLEELGEHEGFQWMELRPRQKDASFSRMRLALEADTLRAMEMVDGFGQTTRLYFSTLRRNPDLDKQLFTFEPPAGVDVIGEEK